jgi:hypothetical protein
VESGLRAQGPKYQPSRSWRDCRSVFLLLKAPKAPAATCVPHQARRKSKRNPPRIFLGLACARPWFVNGEVIGWPECHSAGLLEGCREDTHTRKRTPFSTVLLMTRIEDHDMDGERDACIRGADVQYRIFIVSCLINPATCYDLNRRYDLRRSLADQPSRCVSTCVYYYCICTRMNVLDRYNTFLCLLLLLLLLAPLLGSQAHTPALRRWRGEVQSRSSERDGGALIYI